MARSVGIIGTRGYPSYYGGFETAVRRLAPYLTDRGWEVSVYGRPDSTSPDDPTRDHRVRTPVTAGIESKSLSTLSYGATASRQATRQHHDVALVMNVANGYWLPLLQRSGVPTVVNVDGIEWHRAKWGRLAKGVFYAGARATARYGDILICDSTEIQAYWKRCFKREGLYIPYGGDLLAGDLPVEPGLSHRGYILAVARLVPENTIDQFLEAAASLARSGPLSSSDRPATAGRWRKRSGRSPRSMTACSGLAI